MNENNVVYEVAVWLIPLVVAIVLHEVSHGWVANFFGDPTARRLGRLSPNPVRHIDPFGTIILPLVLTISHAPIFGWAKPVPVVARRLRNPRVHMMIVALAGPGMNLLLALLAAILLGGVTLAFWPEPSFAGRFLGDNLYNFLLINVFLALFNLIPLPPFDGGHVVEGLLPRPLAAQYAKLGRFGFPLLIGLLVVLPMLAPSANVVARLVMPPVRFISNQLLSLTAWLAGA